MNSSATSYPKISIFIPCYNSENYIVTAVESAFNQDYPNIELVICDDGSTDNSFNILSQLKQDFSSYRLERSCILLRHNKNRGIAAAWSTCLENCSGKYILQLDADDSLYPNAASHLSSFLTEDIFLSAVFGECDFIGDSQIGNSIKPLTMPTFNKEYLFYNDMNISHPRMFRLKSWQSTEGIDKTLSNAVDYDAMIKLAEVGDIKYIPQKLYHYRIHENQTTRKNSQIQKKNAHLVRTNSFKRRKNSLTTIEKMFIKGPEDFSSFIIRKRIRQLKELGIRTLIIYGAGKHSQKHLTAFQGCELDILAFLDDHAQECQSLAEWQIKQLQECIALNPDAFLISSDSSEDMLYDNLKSKNIDIPVYKLYS